MDFNTLLQDWFNRGGIFMWPLVACSIVSLAVIIDRLWVQARAYTPYTTTLERIRAAYRKHHEEPEPSWLGKHKAPMAQIAHVYFDYARVEAEFRNDVLQREGERILSDWNRNIRVIATIAQVSPLIGLLGTVYGLVQAFYRIQEQGGRVSPGDLAGGIWEALLTTVAGLIVAIPAFLMYQYFQASADVQARRMRSTVIELDEIEFLEQPDRSAPPAKTDEGEKAASAKPAENQDAG